MKLAIMQPYFFPYLGYFQLIASVDKFVVLDDVHYVNKGWINRNRIWNNGAPAWLTMPLRKASQNRLIREIEVQPSESWRPKILRTLEQAYARAPFKEQGLEIFRLATQGDDNNLSLSLFQALRALCETLSIDTELIPTSSHYPKNSLAGQERILSICLAEQAATYINPPGGKDLYEPQRFAEAGVELIFQQPQLQPPGLDFSSSVGATLSIIDLLFLNPIEKIADSLGVQR